VRPTVLLHTSVLVPKLDGVIGRATGNKVIGIERHRPNPATMTKKCPQQIASAFVPEFYRVVRRAAGKHERGIKGDGSYSGAMATKAPQQIATLLVPEFGGVVPGTTGKHGGGIEGDGRNPITVTSKVFDFVVFAGKDFMAVGICCTDEDKRKNNF
jgi:hypothetical protein